MRNLITCLILLLFSFLAHAQSGLKLPEVDKSPMDISYYPNNYPVLKIQNKTTDPLMARVIYSRPQKQGRKIFGELVEYGKVWRLGANEATEIEFYREVRLGNKKISKGRYTIYAIAYENYWTFIINKDTDTWGAFKYDAKKDVARLDVSVQKTEESAENLSMIFDKSETGMVLIIAWEQMKATIPFTL